MTAAARSFAEVVDPLSETRLELVREIRHTLARYEQHRRDEDRGRLLQLLDDLALLVRSQP